MFNTQEIGEHVKHLHEHSKLMDATVAELSRNKREDTEKIARLEKMIKESVSNRMSLETKEWGYDAEAPAIETKDALTKFVEHLNLSLLPNLVEDEVTLQLGEWEDGKSASKYIDAKIKRDKVIASFKRDVPKFDGLASSVDTWAQRMIDLWVDCEGRSFSKETQISFIWAALTDQARAKLGAFTPGELAAKHYTVAEYLEAVMDHFVNKRSMEEAREEYRSRKQLPGEDVISYFRSKQQLLILALPVAERNFAEFKQTFGNGIMHVELMLKFRDRAHELREMSEIIPFLRTILYNQRQWALDPRNPSGNLRGLENDRLRTNSDFIAETGQRRMEINVLEEEEEPGTLNVMDKSRVVCHSCKKIGHFMQDCRSKPTTGKPQWREFKCYNCDKPGHLARDCRGPRRDRTGQTKETGLKGALEKIVASLGKMETRMEHTEGRLSTAGF